MVLVVKNLPANAGDIRRHGFDRWVMKSPLEEGMATHSRILAWRIPWTEEPGGLQSMGPHTAGHGLATEHARTQTPGYWVLS